VARGLVGGVAVAGAGSITGLIQFGRGLTSLENVNNSAAGLESVGVDIYRATREPIKDLMGLHAPAVSQ